MRAVAASCCPRPRQWTLLFCAWIGVMGCGGPAVVATLDGDAPRDAGVPDASPFDAAPFVARSCTNARKDGVETDIDCGGECRPCTLGAHCAYHADCESNRCLAGACTTARKVRLDFDEPPAAPGPEGRVPVLADFDGDQHLDLVTLEPDAFGPWTALGRYDGSFLPAVHGPAIARNAATWWSPVALDVDGDGRLDLVAVAGNPPSVTLATPGSVGVFLGRGDGSFDAPNYYGHADDPATMTVGDLDGDGREDLVVGEARKAEARVLISQKDGTFRELAPMSLAAAPVGLAAADFDGDGHTDLAYGAFGLGPSGGVGVALLPGLGDGHFGVARAFDVPAGIANLVAVDLDGDGKKDLVTGGFDGPVVVLYGRGDGTLGAAEALDTPNAVADTLAADLDGDGRLDLVQCGSVRGDLVVLRANAARTYSTRSPTPVVARCPLLLGDGDRDGKTDLVASRGAATLYAGDGQGGFGVTGNALPASGGGLAVAADFDGDGATDLALANSDGDALGVRVLRNQGGAFVMGPVYASGYWSSLLAADLDGDGHTDLAGTAFQTGRIEWLLGAGDGSFRAGAGLATGQDPRSLYIGDLDRDGATDLAVVEYGDHDLRTYYGDGHGGFGAPVLRALGDAPYALLVADWTGDGKLDLLVIENNAAEVLVAAGGRDYAPPTRLPGLGGVSYAPAHDWNGDGKLDLAATYHFGAQGGVQLFAGNGDGSFADPVVYASTTASLVALDAADFDGDGAIDLVGIGGALVVLLGDGRGGFEAGGEYAAGAGGTHLVVLDANADHAPDVLVGQTTLLTNRRR